MYPEIDSEHTCTPRKSFAKQASDLITMDRLRDISHQGMANY